LDLISILAEFLHFRLGVILTKSQGRETAKAFPLYTVGTLLPFLVPAKSSIKNYLPLAQKKIVNQQKKLPLLSI
jgi:hypothetical protein